MDNLSWRQRNSPFAQPSKKEEGMIDPTTPKGVYLAVLNSETTGARLARGTQSTITPADNSGWIEKRDGLGTPPQVEWETEVYRLLQELGGEDLAPEFDSEAGDEDSLVLRLVNNAASLEDYAVLFATQPYATAVWVGLCESVGRLIAQFHELGFVHTDLHYGNVVVGLEEGVFRPYLIDFGITQHADLGAYPHALAVEPDEDSDLERLDESLRDICSDPEFLKGLEALAVAYHRY